MTGQPEQVPPLAENAIPEVAQHGYQAYPLVDHVADKIAATYERYGTAGMPSTRYRDLIDLVSIVAGASVTAADQATALVSEFARRQLKLPAAFDVPDRRLWEPGYAIRTSHHGQTIPALPSLELENLNAHGTKA